MENQQQKEKYPPPMEGKVVPDDIIQIDAQNKLAFELRPTQLLLSQKGAKGDKPSIAIVMESPAIVTVGRVSLEMLSNALQQVGYQIIKTEKEDD